ncbi:MAG TPA: SEC-C metal-binding domain-containing protein, partial [Aggregatilineales bacterium]|nr:SEC-C metal-binding domain-containing protein [Aggregatilineales bacterium]
TDPENAWRPEELYRDALRLFPVPFHAHPAHWQTADEETITVELTKTALTVYDGIEQKVNSVFNNEAMMRQVEREVMLRAIDQLWMRHLTDLDVLREGIGLVAYAQRDPLVEYKREAFMMWEDLKTQIKHNIAQTVFRIDAQPVVQPAAAGAGSAAKPAAAGTSNTIGAKNIRAVQASVNTYAGNSGGQNGGAARQPQPQTNRDAAPEPIRADVWAKTKPNDPCPCGSGKKYKYCHYREIQEKKVLVNHDEVKRAVGKRRK